MVIFLHLKADKTAVFIVTFDYQFRIFKQMYFLQNSDTLSLTNLQPQLLSFKICFEF